jgi:hypothetical protein
MLPKTLVLDKSTSPKNFDELIEDLATNCCVQHQQTTLGPFSASSLKAFGQAHSEGQPEVRMPRGDSAKKRALDGRARRLLSNRETSRF